MKQQAAQKKFLPMKPNGGESNTDQSTIADVDIGDDILDTSLEEDLWLDTFPDQGILGTTEPEMEEENCFQSIWDIVSTFQTSLYSLKTWDPSFNLKLETVCFD